MRNCTKCSRNKSQSITYVWWLATPLCYQGYSWTLGVDSKAVVQGEALKSRKLLRLAIGTCLSLDLLEQSKSYTVVTAHGSSALYICHALWCLLSSLNHAPGSTGPSCTRKSSTTLLSISICALARGLLPSGPRADSCSCFSLYCCVTFRALNC